MGKTEKEVKAKLADLQSSLPNTRSTPTSCATSAPQRSATWPRSLSAATMLPDCASYEQQLDELYGQIGRLTTQLAWIKRIWPRP